MAAGTVKWMNKWQGNQVKTKFQAKTVFYLLIHAFKKMSLSSFEKIR